MKLIMPVPWELYNIKFADYMESLRFFYQTDHGFTTLCHQYCSAKRELQELQGSIMLRFFSQKGELENLVVELEEEILIYLIRK